MDTALRCNSLKCRAQLTERAVVTTCSHIFCIPCAGALRLSDGSGGVRICPACETNLINPDDAVDTPLNPTEDYKTSVLSGLSPSIIVECASRGMAFYTYQTSQEIIYQEFLSRSLTDKYATLSSQMDMVIHEANAEISTLRDKLSAMHTEQKGLEQKNSELQKAFRDKARSQQQLSRLYQTLKQQQVAAGMEIAADHDAEHALHAASTGLFGAYSGGTNAYGQHGRAGSGGSGGSTSGRRDAAPLAWPHQVPSGRSAEHVPRTMPAPAVSMGHRTPLSSRYHTDAGGGSGTGGNGAPRGRGLDVPPAYRQPLSSIDPNLQGRGFNSAGYGMSAGMKIGRQPGGFGDVQNVVGGRGASVAGFRSR